jgi:hypothetical protein
VIIINTNNFDLLNVQSVVVIPKMKTSTQKEKNNRKGANRNSFSKLFDSVVETEVDETVAYQTNGYTKNAKSFNNHYETKDYN